MKTIYSIILICLFTITLHAQNFEEAIQKGLEDFAQSKTNEEMVAVANFFERVANAEPNQWLPGYYTAYVYAIICFRTEDLIQKESYLEKAQAALDQAIKVDDKNSEIHTLQGMLYQAYIGLDPAANGMIYSGKANTSFEFAKKYDETNPRPIYLQALSVMYTPEQYGGGKQVACPMFNQAIALFEAFKPVNELMPNWGKEDCEYNLSQCSDVANAVSK